MRESKSDRGGMDGAIERSLENDGGRQVEGTEKRLGRDYEPRGRGKSGSRGKKSRRSAGSARRSR